MVGVNGKALLNSKFITMFILLIILFKYHLNRLTSEGEYERAACISIFHNDFDKAIEILSVASQNGK